MKNGLKYDLRFKVSKGWNMTIKLNHVNLVGTRATRGLAEYFSGVSDKS